MYALRHSLDCVKALGGVVKSMLSYRLDKARLEASLLKLHYKPDACTAFGRRRSRYRNSDRKEPLIMTTEGSSRFSYPEWFWPLVGSAGVGEGARIESCGVPLVMADGLLRDEDCHDSGQAQTRETFGYKWQREDSYGSPAMIEFSRNWLEEGRYAALLAHPAADLSGAG